MDDAVLTAAFRAHIEGKQTFTRRMAIVLSIMSGQTPRAIVLRLERMKLLKSGSWGWFVANGGITDEQIEEVRASIPTSSTGEKNDG